MFLCDKVQKFIAEFGDYPKAARVAILKLDHLYYKNDSLYAKIKEAKSNTNGDAIYVLEGNT